MKGGEIWGKLKEYLFPVFCAGCGKEGEWWCDKCRKEAKEFGKTTCVFCAKQADNKKICEKCQAACSLNGAAAFFVYEQGAPISSLIKDFKYRLARDIASVWDKVAEERADDWLSILPPN